MFQLRPPSVRPVVSGPGPDVNTAPAFVLAQPPQETSPVWPLCIPKHAYPMAIDECRALQSRANISQGPAFSGKTSEGGFMFWIWIGGSGLRGVGVSDLYALGLPVLLFQRFVDEDILLLLDCGLWGLWMDNATTPPNAHPFSEPIDFIGTQHMKRESWSVVSLLAHPLLAASRLFLVQHNPIIHCYKAARSHTALFSFLRSTLQRQGSRTPRRNGCSWCA